MQKLHLTLCHIQRTKVSCLIDLSASAREKSSPRRTASPATPAAASTWESRFLVLRRDKSSFSDKKRRRRPGYCTFSYFTRRSHRCATIRAENESSGELISADLYACVCAHKNKIASCNLSVAWRILVCCATLVYLSSERERRGARGRPQPPSPHNSRSKQTTNCV